MVALREGRNHQQRHAGSVTAAPPCWLAESAVEWRRRRGLALLETVAGAADSGTVERVHRRVHRRVHDRRHLVVVPAVGVVIENDNSGFRPFRALLQRVDDAHQEMLFVERVGIAGMLTAGRLSAFSASKKSWMS